MQKPQLSRLSPLKPKSCSERLIGDSGFGLIEVVVAMALIAGAYIGVVDTYQRVRLHYGQIEAQRAQINQAQDQHERGLP
jgi:prepilin-type N-terminal cleavage/methylation domain-containing protein